MTDKSSRILIVEDKGFEKEMLCRSLARENYQITSARDGKEALSLFRQDNYDVVLSDLKMPGMDGIALLQALIEMDSEVTIILMTAYGSVKSAVQAMKLGAFDYLTKPFDSEELKVTIKRALDYRRLRQENKGLHSELEDRYSFHNIVGKSPLMQETFRLIDKAAPSNSTVIIYGENGTGKELVAKAIHYHSKRRKQIFLPLSCAAIPHTLLESELFGYEKGAFTGATARKKGIFEEANGGTFFLDEITELDINMQAKLLRAIQEREIRHLGSSISIPVDVRLVVATNKNMEEELKSGRFREDLYYRINVISIFLPPLRKRKEDIPLLANHFLTRYHSGNKKAVPSIKPQALEALMNYDWPGNVRELQSTIERALILNGSQTIRREDLPPQIRNKSNQNPETSFPLPDKGFSLEAHERELIIQALKKTNGSQIKAAELLGLSYKTLQYRVRKYGI
ncbi:MAG: sigma-54-dependent Fis family transcriptional regulator [Nitrospirae bacterium]|nr:sigma-54-dependent Fis family transcriptional regulator [Nitrospirota bacterium]